MSSAAVQAVDEKLPLSRLFLFGLQHVLVMAASPITSVFLVSGALGLSSELTINLISATFLICGIGSLLQSYGPKGVGAKLPFVMVPGGAPVAFFMSIAKETNLATAVGAVIMTGVLYWLLLPIFRRRLRFFPKLVIGVMLLLVSINLIKLYGSVIIGQPGTDSYAKPANIGLALVTIALTILFARVPKGTLGQICVMLGLIGGALFSALFGLTHFMDALSGPIVSLPKIFPFGTSVFDILASLPLLIFCIISMTEATGQTIAIADVVGKEIDPAIDVPRTIRADGLASILGGIFGTSLIITSGENIGIVQATGARSRYVTATAGVILLAVALLAPLGRLANAIPPSVVGGTALIVFAIIGVMGINMIKTANLNDRGNMFTLAAALTMGLLPIVAPGIFAPFAILAADALHMPIIARLQLILNNGLMMGTLTAVLCNILFNHIGHRQAAQ